MKYTFKKAEHLTSKKIIEQLFRSGKSIFIYPYKWIWMETAICKSKIPNSESLEKQKPTVKLGSSVPKKSFKRAVDRNVINRRIREAYRKNKHLLYDASQNKNSNISLMIIYIAKDILPYCEMEKKMIVSLQKITEQIRAQ